MSSHKKHIPIHLVTGSEDTLKQHYIQAIFDEHPSLDRELCVFKYDLKATGLEEIFSRARNVPFGSDVQIFIIRCSKELLKGEQALLEEYLNNPPGFTVLIFEGGEQVGFKGLDRKGITVRFDSDKQAPNLRDIVVTRVKEEKKGISAAALRLFLERCGQEAERVYAYLDYLLLYTAHKELITDDDVKTVVSESISYGNYDLVNALVARQCDRMLEIFRDATENGMSPQDIMGMINWQLRRVYEAKIMLNNGNSRTEISKQLRIGHSFIDSFIHMIQKFDTSDIEKAIRNLAELDCAIKTGQSDALLGLEKYFMEWAG
ncbi:MAG: DNA polymerase III subunit delta [Candidatus Omnitrophica bacterium]|nr:DNA polymerase III subunit delta [Candidatus Omnitrophota bacterium]